MKAQEPKKRSHVRWFRGSGPTPAAAAGSIISGLYPALRAVRVDVLEALTLE